MPFLAEALEQPAPFRDAGEIDVGRGYVVPPQQRARLAAKLEAVTMPAGNWVVLAADVEIEAVEQ